MILSHTIKNEARRLGFSLVGITNAEPPPHFSFYKNWLKAGYHGQMHYLETDRAISRRSDPRRILPGCKSIVVLGIHYEPADRPALSSENPTGRLASYAWGDDYHIVLKPRLEALIKFIEEQVGHPVANRWYTDTGPVLERDLAQRAGLGWIGKNTCLINPKAGSYFLLAEVLLDLDLEFDAPFVTDHCGTCTACIDACPTDCILPDRTLDANRCISYLTIENKGAITPDLRPLLEDWVFGCDICQVVCPWNLRFAVDAGDPAFSSHLQLAFPDLITELTLTPEVFNEQFRDHPVKRAKRRGYLRNVAVALGNSGSKKGVPVLIKALSDHEPLIRAHAAWALGKIGGENALQALKEALEKEIEREVVYEILQAIGHQVS